VHYDDIREVERADRDRDAETREDIVGYRTELGLGADDEVVEHFLSEHRAGRHPGGMWLTDAEAEEQHRIDTLVAGAREAAEPYIDAHRADFAGSWLGYGVPEYHVGFARDAESHREALERIVPRPEVLRVHAFEYTEAELQALTDRITEDDGLEAEGLRWLEVGIDEEANRVEVEAVAADAATAEAILTRRYGPAVKATWVGSSDVTVGEIPWQLWTADESGRSLTVHYVTFQAYELDRAELEETEDEVVVTVFVRMPYAVKTIGANRQATVDLATPLAGRRVVDGATGRTRERRVSS
jgi:hypothetical protein